MIIVQAKQKLVRRYKYLYEFAYFILAPFMYEQTKEEFKAMIEKDLQEYGMTFIKNPLIYLKINRLDSINYLFEEFLLSENPMEESTLYKFIELKRNDKAYLEQVKYGLSLVEKDNKDKNIEFLKNKIGIWRILEKVTDYLEEQSGDLKNKEKKLLVIDEYYRIARYKNNGKIYTSGRKLNLHDVDSLVIPLHEKVPARDKLDIGIKNNAFIKTISSAPRYEDNCSIFTENEKQQIYLDYHDELPYDLEITCLLEDEYIETMIDTRLNRQKGTTACKNNFIIKESEIFVNPDDSLYRYYQVCPNCGYIVNIPKEILSEGIRQRIETRCSKDENLFRKMYLYSELFHLDKISTSEQKKILKK